MELYQFSDSVNPKERPIFTPRSEMIRGRHFAPHEILPVNNTHSHELPKALAEMLAKRHKKYIYLDSEYYGYGV